MVKKALIALLLFAAVPAIYAEDYQSLYLFCFENGLQVSFLVNLNYFTLDKSDTEARVFMGLPYIYADGKLYYMSSYMRMNEQGEIELPEEYREKIREIFGIEIEDSTEPIVETTTPTVSTNKKRTYTESFVSISTLTQKNAVKAETNTVIAKTTNVITVTITNYTEYTVTEEIVGEIIAETTNIVKSTEITVSNNDENEKISYNDDTDFEGIDAIIIDAGHGGKDPGGLGKNSLKEKDIVLAVSLKLAKLLEDNTELKVFMTRETDEFVSLEDRTTITSAVDLDYHPIFVSIHGNISLDSSVEGIEVYSLSDEASDDEALRVQMKENDVFLQRDIEATEDLFAIIADLLRDGIRLESEEMAELVYDALVDETGAVERGVKSAGFYVLKYNTAPSILVELGFLSHADESKQLNDSSYQSELAEGLYNGILDFIELYQETRGFSR